MRPIVNKTLIISNQIFEKLGCGALCHKAYVSKDDESKLYIKTIYANEGPRLKRYMPRAKGSADTYVKRTSHLTVVVAER